MRVNSTGLGTTTMVANFEDFQTVVTKKLAGQYVGKDGEYIIIGVEAVKPIHWNIRITMDGCDLRNLMKKALRPKVIYRMVKIFFTGSRLD